jgi:hypothetical protein
MTNSTEMAAKTNQFLRKNLESEFLITTILISILVSFLKAIFSSN